MKYFEAIFTVSPDSSDACDVLAAMAGEAGFETFEETENGLKGYVQQSLFDEETLRATIADFPFEGVSITYDIHEAEDRDWNEQWEQEGFDICPSLCQMMLLLSRSMQSWPSAQAPTRRLV